jgi:hypothetical protein
MSVLRRVWDVRPPQYVVGAVRGMPLCSPEDPWNSLEAGDDLLDDAGVGSGEPDYEEAKRGFLIVDVANPHRRDAYHLPIAALGSDGVKRVHPAALEQAERNLPHHPAPNDVRAAAQRVIDHYKRRLAKDDAGEPEPKPVGVDSAARAFRGTVLARRSGALDELTYPLTQPDFDRVKPIVEKMDRRLRFRLQSR